MAVETVYRSTRDMEITFLTRAEADNYDRMLEIAEHLSSLIRHVLPSVSEDDAEKLGVFMAERRDPLSAAFKKNPSAIVDLIKVEATATSQVVPLAKVG